MNGRIQWVQRFLGWLRHQITLGSTATLLLTIFNVVTHGPRHLLLHMGLHALRMPLLRVMVYLLVGPVALMLAGAFGLIWLTYQPTTRADLVPVDGTVVERGHDDQDRFAMVLAEYENTFIPHAEIDTFDAKRFAREVQPGERVYLLVRKSQQHQLNNGDLLVVFEIRSNDVTYVGLGPALAAEHHDRTVVVPWTAGIFGMISAMCAGLYMWDSRRQ